MARLKTHLVKSEGEGTWCGRDQQTTRDSKEYDCKSCKNEMFMFNLMQIKCGHQRVGFQFKYDSKRSVIVCGDKSCDTGVPGRNALYRMGWKKVA